MITSENNVTIGSSFSSRYVTIMVDTISKKAQSSIYITKEGDSRQVAMKSFIGLLSGNFKGGDTVKVTAIGDNEEQVGKDLKLAEELLKGEND